MTAYIAEITTAYVVVAVTCIWIIVSGSSEGDRFVDKSYRFLTIRVPSSVKHAFSLCCGRRGPQGLEDTWNYLVNYNNPIIMIFYLVFINCGVLSYIYTCFPLLPNSVAASPVHKPFSLALDFVCLYVFTKAVRADPGVITRRNLKSNLARYPRDSFIFKEETECATCKLPKPPRSKHCRLCGYCVARYDHHCVWLRTCVGAGNLKWFIAFLVTHCVLCMYGVYMSYAVLWGEVVRRDMLNAQFVTSATLEPVKVTNSLLLIYMLHEYPVPFALIVLCGLLSIMLPCFLGYHLNLIRVNMTTNETTKWSGVTDPDACNIYDRGWRANFADALGL